MTDLVHRAQSRRRKNRLRRFRDMDHGDKRIMNDFLTETLVGN